MLVLFWGAKPSETTFVSSKPFSKTSHKLIILPFVQFDEWMTFFQKKLHSLQIDALISVENYSTMKKPLYEAAPLLGMQLDNKKKQTFSWVAADNFEFVGKHDRQKMSMSSSEYLSFSKNIYFSPWICNLLHLQCMTKNFCLPFCLCSTVLPYTMQF